MAQKRGKAKLPNLDADWILARARDDGCGHLIWTGYSQKGVPKCNCGEASGNRPFSVRRAVWKAMNGREPRSDGMIVNTCEVLNCIEPSCLLQVDLGARLRGRRQSLTVRANMARLKRAESHLDEAAIASIKAAAGKRRGADVGAEHRISPSMVSRIQLGKSWRNYRDPFAALVP
jgi:hypothetical protein